LRITFRLGSTISLCLVKALIELIGNNSSMSADSNIYLNLISIGKVFTVMLILKLH
jgi:hypothetical protein